MVLAAKGLAALLASPPPLRIVIIRRVVVHIFMNYIVCCLNNRCKGTKKSEKHEVKRKKIALLIEKCYSVLFVMLVRNLDKQKNG